MPTSAASVRFLAFPQRHIVLLAAVLPILRTNALLLAQSSKGSITGRVVDSAGAILQGASIQVQPGGASAASNMQGDFTISDLLPGKYQVTVTYIGFTPFTSDVNVAAGQPTRLDAKLQVASKAEEVVVYAERVHGEAEAINRERTAKNILQVLPAEVITSLPNANVADAIGRLPSVTLERDEGEGKYVQIRGTEPRLSLRTATPSAAL